MKLKELKGVNLVNVKIKLTQELKEAYENYSSKGEDEVFLVGASMGDWFISPMAPTKEKNKSRPLYPMPLEVQPSMFLECEVIEIIEA